MTKTKHVMFMQLSIFQSNEIAIVRWSGDGSGDGNNGGMSQPEGRE